MNIVETAHAAAFFLSDGVILTGERTGSEANSKDINLVKSEIDIPVIIGSGVTLENLTSFLPISDALIVGSYFKKDAFWKNELETERIERFMSKVNQIR